MKLIKIKEDHYVVVDDSEIKDGDYKYHHVKGIVKAICNGAYTNEFKITHSTEPLDKSSFFTDRVWGCERLSLGDVKELIGEVDVEKNMWYERNVQNPYSSDSLLHTGFNKGFELGYNQALADNKEKKYTEEDINKIRQILVEGAITNMSCSSAVVELDKYIQSLQPKTEWEVEIVDGKLKLKL